MSYLNLFIAALITLTFSFNATATTSINLVTTEAVKKVEGGPRVVIQAMTTIMVEQPTATHLETTIVDSDGNSVIELDTEEISTVISLEGLNKGTYTVETIDDNGDYQEFSIVVE